VLAAMAGAAMEEIRTRDDQCTELAKTIRAGLDALDKSTRRDMELDNLRDQLNDFQTALDAIKIELKNSHIAHTDREEFKGKHKSHKGILEVLKNEFDWKSKDADRGELFDDRKEAGHNLDTEGGLIAHGDAVQAASKESLQRTIGNVTTAAAIGKETTVKLQAQTQQLAGQLDSLNQIDDNVYAANKILRRMARRIASDKYIWVMVFLVFAAIVFIIVWKNLHPSASVAVPDALVKK